MLEEVATRLARIGQNPSPFGPDPIAGMQAHLEALPVAKTNVVELIGTGPDAEILAPLVNTTIDVYRDRLAKAYQSSSSESMAEADEEVKKLEATVVAKRRDSKPSGFGTTSFRSSARRTRSSRRCAI